MSTSLYWSLVPKEPKENSLYHLKWAMAKRLGQHDGSCSEDLGVVDKSLIPFLEGIVAGGHAEMAEEAQELIDAINKHDRVRLTIHS